MIRKMEQFPAKNPNPVLSVSNDEKVLYSNEAGEPILHTWGMKVGEKVPPYIGELVQKVISQNIPEKMEVKVGKIVYLVEFHPIPEEKCVNIYGFDISDQKELEARLFEAYEQIQTQSEELRESNVELQAQSEEIQVQNEEFQAQSVELEEANEALRDSEGRFRTMANAIPQLAWIAKANGYIYWYNERWYAYTGTTPEQMEGWGWESVHDPTVLPKVLEQWRASIANGKPFDMEFPLLGADGIFRIFLTRVLPLKDEKGQVLQWFGTNTDITEHKQEEHRILRYNHILEGINKIFSNVVQAKTEEELGNTCLSVALEVTGGGIGFVNLMGEDGLLHDTAISESGWNQCQMYDKTGHRRPPGNFIIHGLYGHVVSSGKSFFTNNPPLHPESIGLPSGHPPLTSFLGVPLIQEGEVIGMLGVANREGGYSCEQLEDLEAITPAITQALQRRKAEEALNKAHEECECLVIERTAELEKAYNSLKNSEKGLAEAQKIAHLGNWEWNIKTDKINWSEETYRIFGRNPQEFDATYVAFLSYIHPDDRLNVNSAVIEALRGKHYNIEFRIILANGENRVVHAQGETSFGEDNTPVRLFGTVQDITERKRAEEALRESEERYRAFFNTSAVGTVEIDLRGRLTKVNDHYCQITGYSREELLGMNIIDLSPPDERDYDCKLIVDYLSGVNLDFDVEKRYVRKDGRVIWVQVTAAMVYDNEGRSLRSTGVVQDITERKRAEELLRESEKRFNLAVKAAKEGVWDWNMETDEVWYSSRYKEMLGYSENEIEHHVSAWLRLLHPDDKERSLQLVDAVMRGEKDYEIEFRLRHKDGHYLNILSRGYPVRRESDGKIVRIVGIHLDLTERKQAEEALRKSEERLRALVTASSVVVYSMSPDWSEMNNLYGSGFLADTENPSRYWLQQYILPEDQSHVIAVINEAIRTKSTFELEHQVKKADGSLGWIISRAVPLLDANGKIVEWFGAANDITERKLIEESLRQNEALLSGILEQLPLGVGLVDTQGHAIKYNNIFHSYVNGAIPSRDTENSWRWRAWDDSSGRLLDQSQFPGARALRGENVSPGLDFLYTSNDGREIWTRVSSVPFRNEAGEITGAITVIQDIDEQKRNEEALAKIEIARKQEIHHRIKNNLQVISSLLDLQAEQFKNKECIKDSEVLEAFRNSQDRVISMALIHEELYKGGGFETLNFSPYIEKLAENLLDTYSLGNTDISIKLDLAENVFFDMDIAVPLGMIVNEVVTNSFKHAFPDKKEGEILIKLHREENGKCIHEDCSNTFTLTVSDNGIGVPEDLDIEELDSLGMQLVISLVDQLDGKLELKRDNGTEFIIRFTVTEKNSQASETAPKLIG